MPPRPLVGVGQLDLLESFPVWVLFGRSVAPCPCAPGTLMFAPFVVTVKQALSTSGTGAPLWRPFGTS